MKSRRCMMGSPAHESVSDNAPRSITNVRASRVRRRVLQSAGLPQRGIVADIFLSYANPDRSRAKLFADLLSSCGWSVFWDGQIKAAADWRDVLQGELDKAGAVVVLWSEASVASDWVKEEAERGRSRLVPVRIDEVELPLGFSGQQAVNLVGWRGGKVDDVDKLIAGVTEALGRPPKQRAKIPKSPSQKRRLAAAIVVAGMLLAAYPIVQWLNRPAPIMSQEIVIDTSAGMSAPFDTCAEQAQRRDRSACVPQTLPPAENLALRAFGGAVPPGRRKPAAGVVRHEPALAHRQSGGQPATSWSAGPGCGRHLGARRSAAASQHETDRRAHRPRRQMSGGSAAGDQGNRIEAYNGPGSRSRSKCA